MHRQGLGQGIDVFRHSIDNNLSGYGPHFTQVILWNERCEYLGDIFLQLQRRIVGFTAQHARTAHKQYLHAGAPV